MKKTALQKKWEKIARDPSWVAIEDPAVIAKIKARNARMRAERAEKEAKDGKINMRVPSADLEALKHLADKKGTGYQTLLGMIIHQYVTGALVDIDEARKILKIKVS